MRVFCTRVANEGPKEYAKRAEVERDYLKSEGGRPIENAINGRGTMFVDARGAEIGYVAYH